MFFQFTVFGHLVKHQFIVELCSIVFEISFYKVFFKSNNKVMVYNTRLLNALSGHKKCPVYKDSI